MQERTSEQYVRQEKTVKRLAMMPALVAISTVPTGAGKVDYQKLADRTEFHWRAEESSVLYSLSQMPHEYNFRLDYDPAKHGMAFSFLKSQKVIFTFKGHKHSVFKMHGEVLYYPVFHFSSSGCQIVAYDLKRGKELWKTSLKGIGPVQHSAYRNLITLDVNDDVVTVNGHESLGDYIEFLDRNSGKTVGHRTYNMRFKRKRNSAEPKDALLAAADRDCEIKGRGEWGPETLGLMCRITTDKAEYTIGDKVHILVEVKNNTDEPIALGLEPLIDTGKGDLSRQPAELHMTASQGDPGFFSTTACRFPTGTNMAAKAVVLKPGETYSETVTRTPWGPTRSSMPATAQPGEMKLEASLWQFLTGDLSTKCIEANHISFKVNERKK
jgi:hypothetical protein